MKKLLLITILITFVGIGTANAQTKSNKSHTYKTAVGLRLGYPVGFTIKHFLDSQSALEGILGFWYGGVNITGLYEYNWDIKGAKGLKWFLGGGLDFTSWDYGGYAGGAVAIDAIIGLDYKIYTLPIDISVDWKPSIYFAGENGFYGSGGAISVRYTF